MITLSSCPICSGTTFNHYLNCKDHTTTGEDFSIKACSNCGFTFTDPKPEEQSIGKYYLSNKYISHTGGQKTLFDSIYLLARRISVKGKRKLLERISSGKRILDFGCGTGEFLKEMQEFGWSIAGVEPSSAANQKATELTRITVNNSLDEIKEPKFDVITLWHVLEHLHNLNETLKKLGELLNESGTILIAVPNLKSHDASVYRSYWAAYDVPRHLWHFDQSNMKSLLYNHGFEVTQILPMKMDSYYVSLLSESYQNPKQSKILNLIKGFYTGLKSNFKARRTTNYSSLIYIAKR